MLALLLAGGCATVPETDARKARLEDDVKHAILVAREKDPALEKWFESSRLARSPKKGSSRAISRVQSVR